MKKQFVITVASEKGGVGKTTIATNLAVYLKALREDLPVTIASFDNHFSVDQMFALGPQPKRDISSFFSGGRFDDLVNLGQYGVQYLASAKRLSPPGFEPAWLSEKLAEADSPGILILDTRPILDWFSEAALMAADLVLVPVKDRAALINADSLRQVLCAAGIADRLWLLPSLVDTRARLNAEVKVHQFLTYAARERDYQVLDILISKSPKVEGLSSGFSSCIRPVLTHARNTAVHGQFRQLAEFALQQYEGVPQSTDLHRLGSLIHRGADADASRRRKLSVCPICERSAPSHSGHHFMDMSSRRHGSVHRGCYKDFVDALGLEASPCAEGMIALVLDRPELDVAETRLAVHSCNEEAGVLESRVVDLMALPDLRRSLETISGRSLEEAYREVVLLSGTDKALSEDFKGIAFKELRRRVLREIHDIGLL